jgi:hypothetical protein
MDDESKELVEVSARALAEGGTRAFLDTIFGPAVEVAELLRDQVRYIRWKVQVKTFKRASTFLDEQGIPATRVSMKLLLPILDLSSLEDESDDAMIDRWAALLANAAVGTGRGATVLPSFPRILSELSPEEAVILDVLYADAGQKDVPSLHHLYVRDSDLDQNDPSLYTRCFNLDRLGLLEAHWENVQLGDTDPPRYEHTVSTLEGNALGLSFVLACRPPTRGTTGELF